jgi:hypothetical protein
MGQLLDELSNELLPVAELAGDGIVFVEFDNGHTAMISADESKMYDTVEECMQYHGPDIFANPNPGFLTEVQSKFTGVKNATLWKSAPAA